MSQQLSLFSEEIEARAVTPLSRGRGPARRLPHLHEMLIAECTGMLPLTRQESIEERKLQTINELKEIGISTKHEIPGLIFILADSAWYQGYRNQGSLTNDIHEQHRADVEHVFFLLTPTPTEEQINRVIAMLDREWEAGACTTLV